MSCHFASHVAGQQVRRSVPFHSNTHTHASCRGVGGGSCFPACQVVSRARNGPGTERKKVQGKGGCRVEVCEAGE